jgi:Fe(3+) dicitrate transport protein
MRGNSIFKIPSLLAGLLVSLTVSMPVTAQNENEAAEEPAVMPRVDVIGEAENLERIPGSAEVIDEVELKASSVFTVNEALRKVSGVNVRDEEGFGLRPNIGIRGLNPTRSTKITLLEDGIPLSYAPYGDNASYYHPPIDRFERIEVLKGAGQIAYGPQTIGGVVNYITPVPPREFAGKVSTAAGNRGYLNAQLQVGGNGMLVDYTRKQGEGARDNIESELNDLNFKYVSSIGTAHALTVRANLYTEDSDITYSGLTDAEYQNFGPEYNPFKNDEFETDRKGASLTHDWILNDAAILTTNLYYSNFNRDWWRQASTTTDGQCGAAFTADRLAGEAVDPDICNSIQGRLRSYYTHGIEPRLKVTYNAFGATSEFETGVKMHFEEQNREQRNGTSPTARTGLTVEDNVRETEALSAFVLNRFVMGEWVITPGVRFEQIDSERTNRLPGGMSGKDTLDVTIPSFGITWNPSETLTVFAGAHRGFAPPRTEDIVNGVGISTEVEAEESTNLELGLRIHTESADALQATFFRNDFERLTAVGSIAGGSTPLAQGEALFEGLEISGFLHATDTVYLRGAYTNLREAEQSTAFAPIDPLNGPVVIGSEAGNRQPYAPEDLLTVAVGCAHESFDVQLEAVYVSEQFSDFANTESALPNGNGQVGKLDSYTVWNGALNYRLEQHEIDLFITVKNLTDEVYIVDRTRGILPGAPRLVQAGAAFSF